MKKLSDFALQAAKWNELRYEQKFDLDLTLNLVKEELQEFVDAKDLVEQVDALCDICFIAAGAMWKLNTKFDPETFDSFFRFYMMNDMHIADALDNIRTVAVNFPGLHTHACSLHQIFAAAFDLLSYKCASIENATKTLFIIADSNDTKSTTKIPDGEKYSQDGKGSAYVPPTAALTQLIAGIANEVKH